MDNFNHIANMINTIAPAIQLVFTFFFLIIVFSLLLKINKATKKEERSMPANQLEEEVEKVKKQLTQATSDLDRSLQQYMDLQIQKLREELLAIINSKPGNAAPYQMIQPLATENSFNDYPYSPLARCTMMYNQSLNNVEAQHRFKREFSPIYVDVPNALERRRDPSIEPIFGTSDNGIFMVVEIREEGKTAYTVFPSFDLTVTQSEYEASAFNQLFKCHNFYPEVQNRIAEVVEPAFFNPKDALSWEFKDGYQGTIRFGNPDDNT